MKVVLSAGGRFYAPILAAQLQNNKILEKFFTFSFSKIDKTFLSENLVSNFNLSNYLNYIFNRLYIYKFVNKSNFYVFNDNLFDKWVSEKLKKIDKVDIFVGWSNYFLHSLPVARKKGAKIIAETASGHILEQQMLLSKEYDKFGIKFVPIVKKNIDKILEEYSQADYIIVPSTFAYNSFIKNGISEKKLLLVLAGTDLDFFSNYYENKKDEKFRVIFVGLLNLRKGVQYLLEAWNNLDLPEDKTELLLVGNLQQDLKVYLKNFLVKNSIKSNIVFYGSTDKKTLRSLYKNSSIFVLPSVEDGFGLVTIEAMASGLPVICSSNTGGSDMLNNGQEGFIFETGNTEMLAEKILWCYQNHNSLKHMGDLSKNKSSLFSANEYGKRVVNAYNKIF